jgi:hypothetical protein
LAQEDAEFNRLGPTLKTPAEQQEAATKHQNRREEIRTEYQAEQQSAHQQTLQQVEQTALLINLVLPPGWLPLGAQALAESNLWPALLCILGLALIGTASLWRSYRTTMRLYTGQFSSGKKRPSTAGTAPAERAPDRTLERRLPWLSEHAQAIALASFRSLTRAPEAKMILLTPLMLLIVFGAMFFRQTVDVPPPVRPLMGVGAMAMILLSMIQLIGNQFGFDRSGFRVYVLCSARRREILLGKNLAVAPVALVMGLVLVAAVQVVLPMRIDHFLAVMTQLVSMYLVFCMLANCLSILAPLPVAAGSMRPANIKMIPMLLHLVFMFLFPLVLSPIMLPLGVEVLLNQFGWFVGMPIYLVLSGLVCVAVIYLYRFVLTWEGVLLQAREQKILEIVTSKAE